MSGLLLAVDQRHAELLQFRHEMDESDLGRVRFVGEHRLTEKYAAERQSVQAADEPAVVPAFDGVRIATTMQFHIPGNNRRRNPRATLAVARCFGTCLDHAVES